MIDFDNSFWDAGSAEVGTADRRDVFGCELGFDLRLSPFGDLG